MKQQASLCTAFTSEYLIEKRPLFIRDQIATGLKYALEFLITDPWAFFICSPLFSQFITKS